MIWALYHNGISHKSAIRRGRWVARVRYHAWRTAIPRGWRGPTGPWRSRAEESAALYDTDLVFVLGAYSCSRCGRAQWATAMVRQRRALRGDPVGETGEHSIVGRRLARQRKRRFQRASPSAARW